jgi:hypothetical protein
VAQKVADFTCGRFVGQQRGEGASQGVGRERVAQVVTRAEGSPVPARIGRFA